MDPNANLREQREICREILKIQDDCNADGTYTHGQEERLAELATRLAELVQALDEWIIAGGFLPKAWNRNNPDRYVEQVKRQDHARRELEALRRGAGRCVVCGVQLAELEINNGIEHCTAHTPKEGLSLIHI